MSHNIPAFLDLAWCYLIIPHKCGIKWGNAVPWCVLIPLCLPSSLCLITSYHLSTLFLANSPRQGWMKEAPCFCIIIFQSLLTLTPSLYHLLWLSDSTSDLPVMRSKDKSVHERLNISQHVWWETGLDMGVQYWWDVSSNFSRRHKRCADSFKPHFSDLQESTSFCSFVEHAQAGLRGGIEDPFLFRNGSNLDQFLGIMCVSA